MRWLCLHCPRLPLEVLTRGVSASSFPLAVGDGAGRRPHIVMCNAAARARGVQPGMAAGTARALVQGLVVRARDPAAEGRALERLAQWCGRFTPRVSLAPPCEVLLEVAGSTALFGGERRLYETVRAGAERLGHRVCAALAPTPLGAALLARAGRALQVEDLERLQARLADLPLPVLESATQVRAALGGMGLRTLGDCLRLPRDGLGRRAAPVLADLDRALGVVPDPRPLYQAPPCFEDRLELPAAVEEAGALWFATRRLLDGLVAVLTGRQAGVDALDLRLVHRHGAPTPVRLGLAQPTRDRTRLMELLRLRLEGLTLPAPVVELVLCAGHLVPLRPRHHGLFAGGAQAADAAADLLERLRARLEGDVQGLLRTADHRPERAWGMCRPGEAAGPTMPAPTAARPLWLLPQPLPLEERGGCPWYGGALVLGSERERIESGWWDGADTVRDYFVARTPRGVRLWVFRVPGGGGGWFLHGFFE